MKKIGLAALLASAIMAMASSALAADETPSQDEIASKFDIAFGVDVTSRYVARGNPQSTGPAAQGYIEPSYGIFYAGLWTSTVSPSLVGGNVEFDLYAGVRPTIGNLSLDFGYVRYLYDTGDCCGEAYAKAMYAFNDTFSAGSEFYHDFENATNYGVLKTEVALPWEISFSAAVGTYFDGTYDWNAGFSRTFGDIVTVDLRYDDSSFGPARFVAMLSLDSSLSALRGK